MLTAEQTKDGHCVEFLSKLPPTHFIKIHKESVQKYL